MKERLKTTGNYKNRLELEEAITSMKGTHKYIASKTGVSACTVSRIRAGKDIVSSSPSFKLSKRLDSLWKITKSVDDE